MIDKYIVISKKVITLFSVILLLFMVSLLLTTPAHAQSAGINSKTKAGEVEINFYKEPADNDYDEKQDTDPKRPENQNLKSAEIVKIPNPQSAVSPGKLPATGGDATPITVVFLLSGVFLFVYLIKRKSADRKDGIL